MPLNPAEFATLSKMLDEALDLSTSEFEAWLLDLPQERRYLLPRLRDMLAARTARGNTSFMSDGPKIEGDAIDETAAHVDELIGPYRVIREIGHGGMGTVWLAERADGTLKRQIALKLPRLAWGTGLAERMARERDIGALLEHPNIARLYDAGVDAQGRPYLALEYIDGVPIDQWCADRALAVAPCIRLFIQVVRAVGYAHGRLVVHRDLKPSNVLVTKDGQAHLLDFGIAKLLADTALEDDHLTRDQGRMLTPDYASPEQVKGEPITVASDVYSLGVLLYDLLTRTLPYKLERASVAAIEQAIVDGEPSLASSKAEDKNVARALRGELDAILAKALKREPSKRYATADALADDLQRHLDGERVLAQPDSLGYRMAKTLKRHRVGFSAATAVLIAVLGGAGISVVQAQRAARASERERVVKEFVSDVFRVNTNLDPKNTALKPASMQSLVEGGAQLIQTRFSGQPELQAELYGVVGGVFSDMGAYRLAADYSVRQLEVMNLLHSDAQSEARTLLRLATSLYYDKRLKDASLRVSRAYELSRGDDRLEAEALVLSARIQLALGEFDNARTSLDAADAKIGAGSSAVRAVSMGTRARLLTLTNRMDEAVPVYDRAIAAAIDAEGPLSPAAISIRLSIANDLAGTAHIVEARRYFDSAILAMRASGDASVIRAAMESAVYMARSFLGGGHGTALEVMRELEASRRDLQQARIPVPPLFLARVEFLMGSVKAWEGRLTEGIPLLERNAPALLAELEDTRDRYNVIMNLGLSYNSAGRYDLADRYLREGIETHAKTVGKNHPSLVFDYWLVAENLLMAGHLADADAALDKTSVPDAIRGEGGNDDRYRRVPIYGRAEVRLAEGNATQALALLDSAPTGLDEEPEDVIYYLSVRGEILCMAHRQVEGLAILQQALVIDEVRYPYTYNPWTARTRAVAGLCAFGLGQRPLAEKYAALARVAFVAEPEVSPYYKAPSERLDRLLGKRVAAR